MPTETINSNARITKLGSIDETRVYIWDNTNIEWIQIEGEETVSIVITDNQIDEFEFTCSSIESDEKSYLKEFAYVLFVFGSRPILKGRIQKTEYTTSNEAIVKGNGIEILLQEREFSSTTRAAGDASDTRRCEWINVLADTVATELLQVNPDDVGEGYIIQPASDGIFSDTTTTVTLRVEYGNRLDALAKLAEILGYKWWVSIDNGTYEWDTHYFHMQKYATIGIVKKTIGSMAYIA